MRSNLILDELIGDSAILTAVALDGRVYRNVTAYFIVVFLLTEVCAWSLRREQKPF
jgi:hypothetical protein